MLGDALFRDEHHGRQDSNDRFIFDHATGRLWFDADGIGGAAQQLVATFEQGATVTADDILII